MTVKRLITDLDNSVLDFQPHFEDWAEAKGHRIKRGVINITYELEHMFIDEVNIPELMTEFFACDETMSSFPALDNSVEPIRRLRQQGYEFVAITACEPRSGLAQVRHQNLKNLFGFDFEEVYVTGYDVPKSEVLKTFEPTFWVEDNLKHAHEGAELGHTVFLIDRDYNRHDDSFIRVKDWLEIEERINELR